MSNKKLSVGVDMSLTSTAVTVLDGDKSYHMSYFRNKKADKWQNHFDKFIYYTRYEYKPKEDYSESENVKLELAEKMSNDILYDIEHILQGRVPEIAIEGYAFGASGNTLIDTIASATLLRLKLKKINNNLQIYAPTSLKSWCGRMVYPQNAKVVNIKRQEFKYYNDLKRFKS